MFSIALSEPTRDFLTETSAPEDPDDYRIVVSEACELLSETDCSFHVHGFGQDWPVDVLFDLPTLMEDLPDVLDAVRRSTVGASDFYEQGIQRVLVYRPEGDRVRIDCTSRTGWVPDPPTEWINRSALERMLVDVAVTFARSLTKVDPQMAELEPFRSWRHRSI